MKRRPPSPRAGEGPTIWGTWIPAVAMLASKTAPIAQRDHDTMLTRLDRALANLREAPKPSRRAWRDLTDMVNFLQSLIELEWATDEGAYIDGARNALHEASQAQDRHGVLRLTGSGLGALQAALEQFGELTKTLSARSFWAAVRHTDRRTTQLLRGGTRKPEDIVVAI